MPSSFAGHLHGPITGTMTCIFSRNNTTKCVHLQCYPGQKNL
uniref:Uncharacterized protein n=1 Tax=Arundo donax TaxID=35708 RepID=A0A0A8Y4F9_ARUDO